MTTQPLSSGLSDRNLIAIGIGMTLLGVFLFSVNDAIGKWMLATYALGQFLVIRSAAGLIILAPVIWRTGLAPFRNVPQPGLQVVRAGLGGVESAAFFLAVTYLPLADVTTFYLAAPIFVAILAVLFLGERVGWRRWIAILLGFVGVVIALRPSAAVATFPAMIALGGSLAFAVLIIITRHLRATPNITLVTFHFFSTLIVGIILLVFGWQPMPLWDIAVISVLGALALGAHYSINKSVKLAPASTVAPYHYTIILWAALFGYLMFDDMPSTAIIIGAVLIIGSGLFIFFREQARHPDKPVDDPAEVDH